MHFLVKFGDMIGKLDGDFTTYKSCEFYGPSYHIISRYSGKVGKSQRKVEKSRYWSETLMDLNSYLAARIPSVIRGLTGLAVAKIAVAPEQEDVTPKYIERRLKILEGYEQNLKDNAEEAVRVDTERLNPPRMEDIPAPSPMRHMGTCPYCDLDRVAGHVRNQLLFVAQECKEGELGPATGGMIPKVKEDVEEFIQLVDRLEGPAHVTILAHLAKQKATELLPQLGWISDCEEAMEAARTADELWHRAAKTTQMFYAKGTGKPFA